MPATPTSNNEEHTPLQVPLPRVIGFVRQLSHDLRNHLNAAELQSAFINEIAEDAEVKGELHRLRGMISEMAVALQRLSAALAPVRLARMPYEASAFVEDLRQKVAMQFPQESGNVDWSGNGSEAQIEIDPQVLQQAFLELFHNSFRHERGAGPILLRANEEDSNFVFRLHEPKTAFEGATENWGREPFRKVAHGHYGLGLHRVRSIIESHEGRFEVRYDPASSSLITTVILPVVSAA